MLAVALGLATSVAWGLSDFLGGLKSRQIALLTVLLGSQLTGLVLVVAYLAARGEGPPDSTSMLYAAAAGLAGVLGLSAFYRGLAVGTMSIVAPISSTAAVIPVAVGVATGDRPTTVQALGVALALAGVVVASREAGEEPGEGRVATGAGLALLSAAGFGCFFVAIDSASDGDVVWAMLGSRVTGLAVILGAAAVMRPSLRIGAGDARVLVAMGVLDLAANAMFAVASTKGLLSLVAVLGSLYPVATIVLARIVLGERIRRLQQAGAAGALAGVACIAAG